MRNKRIRLKHMLFIIPFGFAFNSCVSVKPYEKMYLNDADMELSTRKSEKFEGSFLLYREGSSGANGGKSGGGCGCN